MYKIEFSTLTTEQWAYLRRSVNWTLHSNDNFDIAIKNSLLTVSAFYNDEIVGMARLTGDNRLSFFIQDVIVLPAYQKQGIGTLMLNALLNYISKNAAPNAVIDLMASKGKESFYRRLGFLERDGRLKGFGMEMTINPN